MNDYQLIPAESALQYTADFTDSIPATYGLTAVVWSITPSITLSGQTNDYGNGLSSIVVSGATHGTTYNLQAKGTLSNGEVVPKDIALLGFNG